MSEAETLFATLRQSTGDDVVAMLERMVRDAPDHALNKMCFLNGDTPNDAPTSLAWQMVSEDQACLSWTQCFFARIISGVGVSYRARPDGVNLNYHLSLVP